MLDISVDTLLSHMDSAIFQLEKDGVIKNSSAKLKQLIGLSDHDDEPDHILEFIAQIAPYDMAYLKLWLDQTIKEAEVFEIVIEFPNRSAPEYLLKFQLKELNSDNQESYLGIVQRIPLKDKEKYKIYSSRRRFQQFIENLPNAISYKNPDGEIIMANKQWHKLFNPEKTPVLYKKIDNFLSPEDSDLSFQNDQTIITTGESIEKESVITLKDGRQLYTISQKFPLKNHNQKIVGIGTIHTDISKQRAVTKELNQAKEIAEIANRSKTEFLANMSHELRTPLNAIIGFSEILQNELFGPMGVPAYKEYVDDINTGARHLLTILNDILDMSKVEAGEFHLEEEIFEIHRELELSLRFIKERATKHGLKVILNDIPTNPLLKADRRVFKQIMLNLLSNAVKFTERGGTVTIDINMHDTNGLIISVSDTGIGIAEEDIPVILQPFGQADSSLARKVEGTGLGLSLVQRFMALHQGKLEIESKLDHGTNAKIVFPNTRWNYDMEPLM